MERKTYINCIVHGALAIVIIGGTPICKKCLAIVPQDPPSVDYRPTSKSFSPTYTISVSGSPSSITSTTVMPSPSPAPSDS